jgi:hypothetical protein
LDIFIARYNADGTLAWAKQAGGAFLDDPSGIAVFFDGSALVTGYFSLTATFGPSESGETTLASAGDRDLFVAKYNQDGTLAWARRAGGTGSEHGWGISAPSYGGALVAGLFTEKATFGRGESNETTLISAGSGDIFIARYKPDGTLAWAKRAGGTASDRSYSVAGLSNGSALITGRFSGIATFGPGESGETSLTSAGDYDIFVAKFTGALPTVAHPYWSLYY